MIVKGGYRRVALVLLHAQTRAKIPASMVTCIILCLVMSSCVGKAFSTSQMYTFGSPPCYDASLSPDGAKLYVSYWQDNKVVEVNAATMAKTRELPVTQPMYLYMSATGDYLYVLTYEWPGRLARIQLSTAQTDYVQFDGEAIGLALDEPDNKLWVLHRLFPSPDKDCSFNEAVKTENWDTGRLMELNLSTLGTIRTIELQTTPEGVVYSPYSHHLYIAYDILNIDPDNQDILGDYLEIRDTDDLDVVGKLIWGMIDLFGRVPVTPSFWSDDGRYLAYPNPGGGNPAFSFRMIDTASDTVAFDVSMPGILGSAVGLKFTRKVPGSNILWAPVQRDTPLGFAPTPRLVARIDTITNDYQFFPVEGATGVWGDFAVSPDGRTLYLTEPRSGGIYKLTVPNTAPVCDLDVITSMPASGIGQVPVEFDASGSYDPDPGDTLSFAWDFDGDNVYGETLHDSYTGDPDNPTHIYYVSYTGPVHVKVTDGHGGESICSVNVQVTVINETQGVGSGDGWK